jgi:anionic cell wall polymer biosynthesis LytR-Cps2A-Psr (LCP) family protein
MSGDQQPRSPRVRPLVGVQDDRERRARERPFVLAGGAIGAAILVLLFFVTGFATLLVGIICALLAVNVTPGVIGPTEWFVGGIVYLYLGLLGAVIGATVGIAILAVSRAAQSPAGRSRYALDEFFSIVRRDFTSIAAAWSFVLPGVGQAAMGHVRRGALIAIPALSLAATVIGMVFFARGSLITLGVNQQWLTSFLILDLMALAYHLWAMLDVYQLARVERPIVRGTSRWRGLAAAGLLVAATVGVHGAVATVDLNWQHTLDCLTSNIPCWIADQEGQKPGETIAPPTDDSGDQGDPTASGGWIAGGAFAVDPNQSPAAGPSGSVPTMTPAPYSLGNLAGPFSTENSAHWRDDGQLVIMVVGVDAGPGGGRNSKNLRYDSANVLQVDLATGKSAMYGIPRNLHCVPLPPESAKYYKATSACPAGSFPGMFTNFGLEVYNNPARFPYYQGSKEYYMRQITAYERAASMLTGLHVDGTVLVTLLGFVRLIDDLGGIDINVPKTVADHPCGPKNTWQGKARADGASAPFGTCPGGGTHNGYGTPEMSGSIVASMEAAGQASGKQTVDWWSSGGDIAFTVQAGQQHMNGDWALAYARTRFQDDDYHRMTRQQIVLKAVRGALSPCAIASNPAELLRLVNDLGSGMMTNLPITNSADVADVAGLAQHVLGASLQTFSLMPIAWGEPGYYSPYLNNTLVRKTQDIVKHGLDKAPAATSGGGGGGFKCP